MSDNFEDCDGELSGRFLPVVAFSQLQLPPPVVVLHCFGGQACQLQGVSNVMFMVENVLEERLRQSWNLGVFREIEPRQIYELTVGRGKHWRLEKNFDVTGRCQGGHFLKLNSTVPKRTNLPDELLTGRAVWAVRGALMACSIVPGLPCCEPGLIEPVSGLPLWEVGLECPYSCSELTWLDIKL